MIYENKLLCVIFRWKSDLKDTTNKKKKKKCSYQKIPHCWKSSKIQSTHRRKRQTRYILSFINGRETEGVYLWIVCSWLPLRFLYRLSLDCLFMIVPSVSLPFIKLRMYLVCLFLRCVDWILDGRETEGAIMNRQSRDKR
jgi:hypothetical protein